MAALAPATPPRFPTDTPLSFADAVVSRLIREENKA